MKIAAAAPHSIALRIILLLVCIRQKSNSRIAIRRRGRVGFQCSFVGKLCFDLNGVN